MQTNKKDRDPGQLLGWLVFLLVIAGTPLLNVFQQVTGIPVPGYVLPALIGLAIVLNVAVSLLRMANGKAAADTHLPNGSDNDSSPAMPALPVPPFSETALGRPVVLPGTTAAPANRPQGMPASQTMASSIPTRQGLPGKMRVPPIQSPRFDPVITPRAVTISVIGLMLVIGLGIVLYL